MSFLWRIITVLWARGGKLDSEEYVFFVLLLLAGTAVVNDPLPFLGERGNSRWLKISPFVCVYDILWQFTGQGLAWYERVSDEVEGRDALPRGAAAAPPPPSRWRLVLEFASIVQASELLRRSAMPWCQTFVVCYASHWVVVHAIRLKGSSRMPEQRLSITEKARRHRITRIAFLLVCQGIICYLSFSGWNNPGLNHLVLLWTAAMVTCGWLIRTSEIETGAKYAALVLYTIWHIYTFMLLARTYKWPVEKPRDAIIPGFIAFDVYCVLTAWMLSISSCYVRPAVWISSTCIILLFGFLYVLLGSSIRI